MGGLFKWPVTDIKSAQSDNSHLERLTIESVYGTPADDSLVINRATALGIPAVAKARTIMTSSIARMPLMAVRAGEPVPTQPSLLKQLTKGTTNFDVLTWIIDGMIFYGRAWLIVTERDARGTPLFVQVVPESEAEVKDGTLSKAFGRSVSRFDVIRIDAPHEGLLTYGRSALRTCLEVERAAAEAGANPVPAIVLKQKEGTDLRQDEVTALLASWRAARRKRYGSTAYLNKGLDVEALGQSSENLLIEGQNWSVLQVARLLGLPGHILDGSVQGSALNYINQASRNRELLDALVPYYLPIEQTLSLFLAYGTDVVFDTTSLLRQDTKGRYEEYAVAINAGFMTPDEARALEHMSPMPEPKQQVERTPDDHSGAGAPTDGE